MMNLQAALMAVNVFVGVFCWSKTRWISAANFAAVVLLANTYIKFAIVLAVKGSMP